jgi:hypothetical protein
LPGRCPGFRYSGRSGWAILWDAKRFHGAFEIPQTVSRESEPKNAESQRAKRC